MQRLLPMFPLAALLLVTMGVGPCDSKQLGSVQDCTYQGMRFSVGASWTASETSGTPRNSAKAS